MITPLRTGREPRGVILPAAGGATLCPCESPRRIAEDASSGSDAIVRYNEQSTVLLTAAWLQRGRGERPLRIETP